jgi:hypothetical protein
MISHYYKPAEISKLDLLLSFPNIHNLRNKIRSFIYINNFVMLETVTRNIITITRI